MSDAVLFGETMQLNCATQRARDGIQAGKLWATRKPDIKKQEPQKADRQSAEFWKLHQVHAESFAGESRDVSFDTRYSVKT